MKRVGLKLIAQRIKPLISFNFVFFPRPCQICYCVMQLKKWAGFFVLFTCGYLFLNSSQSLLCSRTNRVWNAINMGWTLALESPAANRLSASRPNGLSFATAIVFFCTIERNCCNKSTYYWLLYTLRWHEHRILLLSFPILDVSRHGYPLWGTMGTPWEAPSFMVWCQ